MAQTDQPQRAEQPPRAEPSLLARLGLGYLPPDPPVVGRGARIRWWQRVRSIVVLVVLIGLLGAAVAAAIGAVVFFAGFLLEQAVN